MEVQGNYGRLIQGMSQQPPAVRRPGQVTYQLNTAPDVVDGTKSRPGTKLIQKLGLFESNAHYHHYRRGDDIEEYFVITNANKMPAVYDKNGNLCVVRYDNALADYLSVSNPEKMLRMMTIGDVTFIVNNTKTVRARSAKSPTVGSEALVFCTYAQYGTAYQILIDNVVVAEYTTATGENPTDVNTIKTYRVATELFNKLTAWAGASDYELSRDDTTIHIKRKDGRTIDITTVDGAKGKDLVAIRNRVSSVDLLPARAPQGYRVEVWASGSKPESRYWLAAEPKGEGNLVQWRECLAPDMDIGFDPATMPHTLTREDVVNGIAQFRLERGAWKDRDAGDDLTNPFPSFRDNRISGLFMVQNRMCFANGEAVAMARTSRFYDFFRPSAASTLDTDPIDTFSDASEVYELTDSVSLDGDTVLFSKTAQFLLPGDKALTKANTVLRPTTTFECTSGVAPVATGDAIMFAYNEGAYSGVREFYTDSTTDTKKAQPVTYHVNRLIRGNIKRMVASSNFNRLFVQADQDAHRIYVYDWLWEGQEKVQSAWHLWEFPKSTTVRAIFYSSELVYFIITRPDGATYLEVMDMGDPLEAGQEDQYRLDRQSRVNFRWSASRELWVSDVLPFTPYLDLADAVIVSGGHSAYIGGTFPFSYDASNNTFYTAFDLGEESATVVCVVGDTYPVQIEPTPVVIKDNNDRTSYLDVPTVGQIWVNTDKAPTFSVDVSHVKTGRTRTVNCINRVGGSLNNIGGYVPTHEQQHRVPMRAKSTDITFRIKVLSPHTFQLRDIEWEGSYNPRKRRL